MTIEQTTRPTVRQRVMFGQFLGDDPPGEQRRVRVLVGGSHLTMSLDGALAGRMPDVPGQQVELRVSETLVGGVVVDRVVSDVRRLDSGERGVDAPAQSIDELARMQGIHQRPRPDYFSILSGLWESEEEAELFREEIRSGRAAI